MVSRIHQVVATAVTCASGSHMRETEIRHSCVVLMMIASVGA